MVEFASELQMPRHGSLVPPNANLKIHWLTNGPHRWDKAASAPAHLF